MLSYCLSYGIVARSVWVQEEALEGLRMKQRVLFQEAKFKYPNLQLVNFGNTR